MPDYEKLAAFMIANNLAHNGPWSVCYTYAATVGAQSYTTIAGSTTGITCRYISTPTTTTVTVSNGNTLTFKAAFNYTAVYPGNYDYTYPVRHHVLCKHFNKDAYVKNGDYYDKELHRQILIKNKIIRPTDTDTGINLPNKTTLV